MLVSAPSKVTKYVTRLALELAGSERVQNRRAWRRMFMMRQVRPEQLASVKKDEQAIKYLRCRRAAPLTWCLSELDRQRHRTEETGVALPGSSSEPVDWNQPRHAQGR